MLYNEQGSPVFNIKANEKELIIQALIYFNFKLGDTAVALGISSQTLNRRLEKHDISRTKLRHANVMQNVRSAKAKDLKVSGVSASTPCLPHGSFPTN